MCSGQRGCIHERTSHGSWSFLRQFVTLTQSLRRKLRLRRPPRHTVRRAVVFEPLVCQVRLRPSSAAWRQPSPALRARSHWIRGKAPGAQLDPRSASLLPPWRTPQSILPVRARWPSPEVVGYSSAPPCLGPLAVALTMAAAPGPPGHPQLEMDLLCTISQTRSRVAGPMPTLTPRVVLVTDRRSLVRHSEAKSGICAIVAPL